MSDEDAKSALHALREYDELGWTTRDGIADVIESQQREIEELREGCDRGWNHAKAISKIADREKEQVKSLQSRLDETEAALRSVWQVVGMKQFWIKNNPEYRKIIERIT